jgi:hypothetical protein
MSWNLVCLVGFISFTQCFQLKENLFSGVDIILWRLNLKCFPQYSQNNDKETRRVLYRWFSWRQSVRRRLSEFVCCLIPVTFNLKRIITKITSQQIQIYRDSFIGYKEGPVVGMHSNSDKRLNLVLKDLSSKNTVKYLIFDYWVIYRHILNSKLI